MSRRRRFALWFGGWLRWLAFRLDIATAAKGPPRPITDLTDEEWAAFYDAVRRDR